MRICQCARTTRLCEQAVREDRRDSACRINCARQIVFPMLIVRFANATLDGRMIDFMFSGNRRVERNTAANRQWVDEFALERFGRNSWLQYTDSGAQAAAPSSRAVYNMSLGRGFIPRLGRNTHIDWAYFRLLSRSNFTLAPAGDAVAAGKRWSMRFLEACMSGSLPVVERLEDGAASCIGYSSIPFRVRTRHDATFAYDADAARSNRELFFRHFTVPGLCGAARS